MARNVHSPALREIVRVLARTRDETLIVEFLESILTPSELREIVSRWELVKLIDAGMPQRQIGKLLGISLCKITRGSRELKKKDSAFRRMIQLSQRGSLRPLRRR